MGVLTLNPLDAVWHGDMSQEREAATVKEATIQGTVEMLVPELKGGCLHCLTGLSVEV